MSQTILAKNSRGQKQRFSKLNWDLLGPDKGGWVPVEGGNQVIENAVGKEKQPEKQPEQVIGNQVVTGKEEEKEKQEPAKEKETLPTSEKQKEFFKAVEGISRSAIKDYFDKVQVVYTNKADEKQLKDQLAKHFKYDIVELQKAFSK